MRHSLLVFKFLLFGFLWAVPAIADDTQKADAICGKWLTENKEYLMLVYRDGNTFKGKTLWFKNKDTSKAMDQWTDKHNPDPALRNRKIVGIDILSQLTYDAGSNTWENGKIYDVTSGKSFSAYVKLNKNGSLKLTGYMGFKFVGKSLVFTRYNDEKLVN